MTFFYKDRPSDSSLVETIWQAQSEQPVLLFRPPPLIGKWL